MLCVQLHRKQVFILALAQKSTYFSFSVILGYYVSFSSSVRCNNMPKEKPLQTHLLHQVSEREKSRKELTTSLREVFSWRICCHLIPFLKIPLILPLPLHLLTQCLAYQQGFHRVPNPYQNSSPYKRREVSSPGVRGRGEPAYSFPTSLPPKPEITSMFYFLMDLKGISVSLQNTGTIQYFLQILIKMKFYFCYILLWGLSGSDRLYLRRSEKVESPSNKG